METSSFRSSYPSNYVSRRVFTFKILSWLPSYSSVLGGTSKVVTLTERYMFKSWKGVVSYFSNFPVQSEQGAPYFWLQSCIVYNVSFGITIYALLLKPPFTSLCLSSLPQRLCEDIISKVKQRTESKLLRPEVSNARCASSRIQCPSDTTCSD